MAARGACLHFNGPFRELNFRPILPASSSQREEREEREKRKGIPCNSNSDKDHFAPNPLFPEARTQEAIELGMAWLGYRIKREERERERECVPLSVQL